MIRLRRPGIGPGLRAAAPPWVAARLAVAAALVANAVVRHGTRPLKAPVGTRLHGGLLSWDASWYLQIAQHGYGPLDREGLRFFPPYPLIARWLGPMFGGPGPALVIVANAAALAYGVVLYRFVADDLADERLARRSVWLVAIAPIAFVLVMGYTEPLAGVLAVLTFWMARRGRWGLAGLAGAASGALRPSGAFLVVPLAIEAARCFRTAGNRARAWRAVAVAAPLAGTVPYLAWVRLEYGDWKLPYSVQRAAHLRGDLADPVRTVSEALTRLDGRDLVLGLRGLWALGLVVLLVVAGRRLPASYTAYAAVSLIFATATTNLGSLERYAYGAFPFVIAAATLVAGTRHDRVVFAACTGALACYALLAFLDLYVP
jgi:hypothetical protein